MRKERFYCWSTSTNLEPRKSYTKFGLYAWTKHGGNHSRAAQQLYKDGYGTRRGKDARPAQSGPAPSDNGHLGNDAPPRPDVEAIRDTQTAPGNGEASGGPEDLATGVRAIIAAGGLAALYRDGELIARLIQLRQDDPAAIAAIKADLKKVKGFLARDFDRATAPPKSVGGEEENPHRLARAVAEERFTHPDGPTLRFWKGDFHEWDGAAYRIVPDSEIRGEMTNAIEEDLESSAEDSGQKVRPVTTKLLGNVLQALSGIALMRTRDHPVQPTWGGVDDPPWPASEILAARNALVHLPSLVKGDPCIRPPTPLFFSPSALDVRFVSS